MRKDIKINVDTQTDGISLSSRRLGISSENLQGKIIFTPKPFIDGMCRMYIEGHGSVLMDKQEDCYTLDIKSSLLITPSIDVCFKITEPEQDNGVPIYATKIIHFEVLDTIESNEPIPEQYPQWKDVLDNYAEEKKGELDTYTTEMQTDLKAYKKDLENEMSTTKDTLTGEITATATEETNKFNTNAESKTNAFNDNATEKTTNYNTNAETKIKEYNTNATNKVNEFNNNVDSLENELTELASQMPWNTTEIQDSIHVEDSAKYSRNKLGVFGNLVQEKYSGRNKIPTEWEYWESGHYDTNGLKTTYGSRCRLKELYPVLPSTTYYIDLNTSDSLGFSVMIRGFSSDKVFNENMGVIKNKSAFTTSDSTYYVAITIGHSDTATAIDYEPLFANGTIKPFMCLNSETDKTFEIYTGGEAAPNINYPIMPVVVTGVQKIRKIGKNIFNNDYWEQGMIKDADGTILSNNSYIRTKLIPIKPNEDYVLNMYTERLYEYDINGNWIKTTQYSSPTTFAKKNLKIKTNANTCYVRFRYHIGHTDSIITTLADMKKQENLLAIGTDVNNPYEPYTEETFELDLGTTELCKIVDENNNVVAQDRVVYKDGKWQFEKNVTKNVFENGVGFAMNGETDTAVYVLTPTLNIESDLPGSTVGHSCMLSNIIGSKKIQGNIMFNGTTGSSKIRINIPKKYLEGFASVGDLLKHLNSKGTPLTIYNKVKTVEYEDCTLAQSEVLDKLYKLRLQQGTNNIYVESENGVTTELQLTYMQDLMSQINELKQAMLNIGGN